MKKILTCIVLSLIIHNSLLCQVDYTENLIKERNEHKAYMLSDSSFLNKDERANIISLAHFEPDTNYIVTASVKKKRGPKFEMITNTDRRPIYRQYALLTFTIKDTTITIPIYQSVSLIKRDRKQFKDYLFLPIKDATSFTDPIETHGAGRYLELTKSKGKTMVLDLNELFNPYCAYSDRYSCPITPEANILDIRIEAGEKYPKKKDVTH